MQRSHSVVLNIIAVLSSCPSGLEVVKIHHVDNVKSAQCRNICVPPHVLEKPKPTNKFVKYRLAWLALRLSGLSGHWSKIGVIEE